jgi:cell division protein FtsW
MRSISSQGSLRGHRADYGLILALSTLVLFGLVIIYSISPVLSRQLFDDANKNTFLYAQLRNIFVAIIVGIVCSRIHWRKWRNYLPVLIIASGLSLLFLLIPGLAITEKGATRWVGIGSFSFQPAEILKFSTLIGVAVYGSSLSKFSLSDPKKTLWPAVGLMGLLGLFVLILQKDMGTMLVLVSIVVIIFYASGASIKQFNRMILIGVLAGIASIAIFPHRVDRVLTFFNPSADLGGTGYHLNQALIGVGSGGLLGVGVGKSVQVFGYLPEAPSDSIFAIIAESFGFVGALATVLLLGFILYRGFRIALNTRDKLAKLLALGIVAWIGSQSVINISAIIGLVPLTGIPLPFLSYGGTSLTVAMAAMGILINLSKHTERGNYANTSKRWGHRGTYNSANRGNPSS